jgi:hypothetical protein
MNPSTAQPLRPGQVPQGLPTYSYTLKAAFKGAYLQFSFDPAPPPPVGSSDGALVMRVPEDCRLELTLDPAIDWYFPGDPIQLVSSTGVHIPDIADRYFDLQPSPLPPRCRTISFYARKLVDPYDPGRKIVNLDRFNILVALNQQMRDGVTVSDEPLYLLIDPGIKNPGDDTVP